MTVYKIIERLPDGRERTVGTTNTIPDALKIARQARWAVTIRSAN